MAILEIQGWEKEPPQHTVGVFYREEATRRCKDIQGDFSVLGKVKLPNALHGWVNHLPAELLFNQQLPGANCKVMARLTGN